MMSLPGSHPTADRRRLTDERGSLLLTAMLFAIGLAIVLGSYLSLSRTTLKLAHRAYFANDATNLAEAGLEEALYCFNQLADGNSKATVWSEWSLSGSDAMRTLPTFNRDQNAIGIVKVYVIGYDGSNPTPTVISQATLSPFNAGAPIVKTLQISLSLNVNTPTHGVVALNGLNLKDNSYLDSFNSNPSGKSTGPWLPYSKGRARSNASVVVMKGKVNLKKGDIYGDLYLGPKVKLQGGGNVTGTITTDYSYDLPMPVYPTQASVSRSYQLGKKIPKILPRTGDQPASDGRYYYFCEKTKLEKFFIRANRDISIIGRNTKMKSGIDLPNSSTLHVYMDGALTLRDNDQLNSNGWAGALRIYTTTNRTCSIGGNSQISVWLQAPNARLQAKGGKKGKKGGKTNGSELVGFFLAKSIKAENNAAFHYDESLQPQGSGSGGASTAEQTGWLELQSAADQASIATKTNNFLQ